MNVLEDNRDNYLKRSRSPGRVAAIVGGVIAIHLIVITAAAHWRGWNPKPGEGLIRVNIVPGKPALPEHP